MIVAEMIASMIGRKVESPWHRMRGVVLEWRPLNDGSSCDVLVREDSGRECWYGSSGSGLRPTDGLGALPSRAEVCALNRAETLASLQAIRAAHVREFHKPWPGLEHGKAILGRALDGAIADVKGDIARSSRE